MLLIWKNLEKAQKEESGLTMQVENSLKGGILPGFTLKPGARLITERDFTSDKLGTRSLPVREVLLVSGAWQAQATPAQAFFWFSRGYAGALYMKVQRHNPKTA